MRFSRRAKRRIIVIGAAGLAVVLAGGVFKVLRGMQQSRLQAQSRAEGLAAYESGDFDEALERLGYVIAQDKTDAEVILAFADARARTPMSNAKHVLEALGYYRAGVDLLKDPASDIPDSIDREQRMRECWSRMIEMYSMLGMRYEVRETADRLLADDPNNVEALTAKVQVLYAEREFNEALRTAARLIELQPQAMRWRELYLAIMRESGADHSDLLAQCGKWMNEHQGDGRYHVLEAAALADAGRYGEATAAIRDAAVLGADTLAVLSKMISILDALGQYELADDVINVAGERYPDAVWVQQAAIRRLWQANRIDEALAKLEAIERTGMTSDPDLVKLKALCLMAGERVEEAVQVLEPLTVVGEQYEREHEVDRAWARAIIARATQTDEQFDAVLRDVEHALVLMPRDAVLHSILGKVFADMGEDALAVQHYERAYRLDPSWLAAGVTYIESLLRSGRVGEAYRTSVDLLRRQPTDVLAPFILCARSYLELMRSGQLEQIASTDGPAPDVVGMLETLHEQRPGDATIAGLLAEGYVLTGRDDLARRFIDTALGNPESSPPMLLELARVGQRYDVGSARGLIEKAVEQAPDSLTVAYSQADLLAQAGKVDEGLAVLERAIATIPPDAEQSHVARRARVRFMLRVEHPEAMNELRSFVTQHRDSTDALGFALEQSAIWDDRELVRTVIDDLAELVGRSAQQVRLAEANYLLRYNGDTEADLARAMMLVNGVLEESPDSLAALTLLANASLMGERPSIERAIVNLQRAVERYPGATSLYPVFIDLLQRQGDYTTADRYLTRFAALAEREPRLRHEEIRLLRAQGDFERALIKATTLINETSNTTDQLALASLYRRSGRSAEARAIYERLLAEASPSPLVIERAAEFYALTGDVATAEQLLRAYEPAAAERWRKDLLLGRFAMQYGDASAALKHLQAAADAKPNDVDVLYELARYYLAAERFGEAHQTAMAGLQNHSDHQGLRAVVALSTIRLDPATQERTLAFWRGLGASDDALLDTLTLLQSVRFENGRAQPTASDLEAARKLATKRSSYLPAWTLAISLMADAGKTNDAIEMARRAVGRFPTEPQVARWATTMLMNAGRWQEALMEAQEWRRRTLDDPIDADVAMTRILLELDRPADAMAQIGAHGERIIDQRTRRPGRVGPWLRTLLATNQWDRAASLATTLVADDAMWRSMWVRLSETMTPTQAYDALSMVETEIEQPREYLELAMAWNNLAARTDELSYSARADALAVRASEMDAALQTPVLMTRGLIAEGKGDDVAAERYYRQVIDRDAENVTTLNNLAYLLVRNGRRFDQALPLIERAVNLMPDHPDLLDTLGQVQAGLGQLDKASETLERARTLRPQDMDIGLNLAEVLIERGAIRDASSVLDDVRAELELTWPKDERIVQRLEALRTRLDERNVQAGSYDESSSSSAANHAGVMGR